MLKVLIVDKSEDKTLKIAKIITAIYTDSNIITISDIDNAIKIIKSDTPNIVVVCFDLKDSKGRDLLERLGKWSFEILIFHNEELYCIQDGKEAKKEGYVLKYIETKPIS